MNGYLHLKGVIQGEALETARAAAVRYAHADPATLPAPFDEIRRGCDARVHQQTPNTASQLGHAFAFDKSLPNLTLTRQCQVGQALVKREGVPELAGGVGGLLVHAGVAAAADLVKGRRERGRVGVGVAHGSCPGGLQRLALDDALQVQVAVHIQPAGGRTQRQAEPVTACQRS